jgi:hypothetical protein
VLIGLTVAANSSTPMCGTLKPMARIVIYMHRMNRPGKKSKPAAINGAPQAASTRAAGDREFRSATS